MAKLPADQFDWELALQVEESPTSERDRVLVSSREALADAALLRALRKAGRRDLQRERAVALVVQVPSEQWSHAIKQSAERIAKIGIEIALGADKPKARDEEGYRVAAALSRGTTVVGISPSPDTKLPRVLLEAHTHRISVAPANIAIVAAAMKRCMVGRAPAGLKDLDISGMDFDLLCACLPRGAAKQEGLLRLRRAIEVRKATFAKTEPHLPPLEHAVEYGAAREWRLDLARDIADLRAGLITWRDVDRGAVLEGPPGSGKTTFARMLGEACKLPTVVGSVSEFFASSAGDLGAVIKAQRALFERATAVAPCFLFLDEINALPDLATLSPKNRDWWTTVILDFYLLLDSAMSSRDGIIVVGATNRIEDISAALLRPGRLERSIHVGFLTVEGLASVLRTHLRDELPDQNLTRLAEAGAGATAAMAMDWVRSARRRARRAGRQLAVEDIFAQIAPPDTRSEAQRYRCAVHEAGHAVVGLVLGLPMTRVSIQPRTGSGGSTSFAYDNDILLDRTAIESSVTMILGAFAAEAEIIGSPSSGAGGSAQSDLARATEILPVARTSLGLSGQLLWRCNPKKSIRPLSKDAALRAAVEGDLERLCTASKALVLRNRDAIRRVADRLLIKPTLSDAEVAELAARIDVQIDDQRGT